MKIPFYGIGYVGLVQAAVLADAGHEVCCVHTDQDKIDKLKDGIIPIYEPSLTNLDQENYKQRCLIFTRDDKQSVIFAKVQFITVGTPPDEDGKADLKYVLKVVKTIATYMINDKPTVPADKVAAYINSILVKRLTTEPLTFKLGNVLIVSFNRLNEQSIYFKPYRIAE